MRRTGVLGMYCVLVREGPRLSHRFKLKVTLSLFVQERLGQRGCVQWRRRGGMPACVYKEVHAAALVIVLIREYFPEFLWHLRALPRMPFLKLLFDFQGRCSTHTHIQLAPSRSCKTHNPFNTWLLSPLLTGKWGCGGRNNDRADYN